MHRALLFCEQLIFMTLAFLALSDVRILHAFTPSLRAPVIMVGKFQTSFYKKAPPDGSVHMEMQRSCNSNGEYENQRGILQRLNVVEARDVIRQWQKHVFCRHQTTQEEPVFTNHTQHSYDLFDAMLKTSMHYPSRFLLCYTDVKQRLRLHVNAKDGQVHRADCMRFLACLQDTGAELVLHHLATSPSLKVDDDVTFFSILDAYARQNHKVLQTGNLLRTGGKRDNALFFHRLWVSRVFIKDLDREKYPLVIPHIEQDDE